MLVQAALRNIGITVDVKYYPLDMLYAPEGMGGILHGGKFDLLIFGWFAGIDPDNSSQLTCANFPPNGYNDNATATQRWMRRRPRRSGTTIGRRANPHTQGRGVALGR